jgi:phosphatidylinositol glycan class A protein
MLMVRFPLDFVNGRLTSCSDIINALGRAISIIRSGRHDPFTAHERLKDMYSWATIAERTERVYDRVLKAEDRSIFERMARCVPHSLPKKTIADGE